MFKQNSLFLYFITASIALSGCLRTHNENMNPPKAKKIAKEMVIHGNTRTDNYYWLNDRDNPDVIAYLESENAYTKEMMKSTETLQKDIYNEIVGRIKQNDESVPYDYNG